MRSSSLKKHHKPLGLSWIYLLLVRVNKRNFIIVI